VAAHLVRELGERPMAGFACPSVVDEEPRAVPPLGGSLGDELGREVIVELG
jgi:hypothetical protein